MPRREKKRSKDSSSDCSESSRTSKTSRTSKKSGSKSSCSSRSSCSSSESSKLDCGKLYCKFVDYLLRDPSMFIAGSNAHNSLYSIREQMITLAAPVNFDFNQDLVNIDHKLGDAKSYVRVDGTFSNTFVISTNEGAQFTGFHNAQQDNETIVGTNTGAGMLVSKHLDVMDVDESISIRNYSSSNGTITLPLDTGGVIPGTNTELVMNKIAPNQKYWKTYKHLKLSRKEKKLFKSLFKRMLCDEKLMLLGSDAYGSFFSKISQIVDVEQSVTFELHQNVKNLKLQANNSDVLINKDGSYFMMVLLSVTQASQFAIFVNGVPNETTTSGVNKGANQIMLRQILHLKKGDLVSLRNHTSALGQITIVANSGGVQLGIDAILILMRVSDKPECILPAKEIHKNYDEEKEKCERPLLYKFRNWLSTNKYAMATGSDVLGFFYSRQQQIVDVGQPFVFEQNGLMRNISHTQGKTEIRIHKSGIFKVAFDALFDRPTQFTLFVNGKPDISTTSGSDSGAGQVSMRQLVALCEDDVLTLVNYQSGSHSPVTLLNPGGYEVGNNGSFVIYKIAQLPDNFERPRYCECKLKPSYGKKY